MTFTIKDENGEVIQIKSRRDADGRVRWYDPAGVDTEVSGRDDADAREQAEAAWGRGWDFEWKEKKAKKAVLCYECGSLMSVTTAKRHAGECPYCHSSLEVARRRHSKA